MSCNEPDSAINESASAIVDELDGIRQSLENISYRLDNAEMFADESEQKKEENHQVSRLALMGGFGLLGLKLGGLVGAKLGYVRNFFRPQENQSTVSLMVDELNPRLMGDLITYGAVGGVVGAGSGAILGWKRGDRIDNPGDLLTKPIESLQKIFGTARVDHSKYGPDATQSTNAQGGQSQQWQKYIIKTEQAPVLQK